MNPVPRFRVLITDYAWPDLNIERQILSAIGAELTVAPQGDEATLVTLAAEADAILTCWAKLSATVIQAASRCRMVSRMGIGLDNIDIPTCTQRGIVVTNVPDYCLTEVAEHTLALILTLGRKTAFFHHETKLGRYQLQAGPPLRRLEGQTLGIFGLGKIGRTVAVKALAFGLRVLATTRPSTPPIANVEFVSFDHLLSASDFVSLHLPLTTTTKHLIGREQLSRMKPTAYLINTARGGLLDHAALADALQTGKLAGAALDVQDPEPPDLSQPPFNDPRVLVTPHAAFASEESLANLRRRATQQVATLLTGGVPENIINVVSR